MLGPGHSYLVKSGDAQICNFSMSSCIWESEVDASQDMHQVIDSSESKIELW